MTTDCLPSPAPGTPDRHFATEDHPGVGSVAVSAAAARLGVPDFYGAASEFSVFDAEPDWTDGRYRVYAAHNEADCIRYGQGKRYDFCISRRHHNYYLDYQARKQASYYFIYDDARSPLDKTHITVVAARPDGTFEFTYANNAEDYDTRRLRNDLDLFLETKPGLEQAKDLFTCQPLTPEEATNLLAAQAASSGAGDFEALTPAQQLLFVRLRTTLTDAQYKGASSELRDAYISRAHLLTDQQAACSTEAQRRRAAALFRLYNAEEWSHTAEWLQRYPPPTPAMVAAHYIPQWPASAAAPVAGRRPVAETFSVPATEDGAVEAGHVISGPHGSLCLTKLQRAVAANTPTLFPVQELAPDSTGAASGSVIIARVDQGYVVLTGSTELLQAQMAGDADIVVRLATRANLAYARVS
ncbi:hypothetical protein [Hymenobacter glacialis]|uniref:Uncharacterized protein n=1 Tax=Hymenobacter glacialis TaxID=1908236 RepID=A0A1G1SX44_9BACT|nr:hypothetical protein [Hymenobacter glacialis]OGX83197.1 hypothetical protein BEN48_17260 [Hymenobacter glacialis]